MIDPTDTNETELPFVTETVKEPTQEVTLTAPHTHAGRGYLSGEKMEATVDVKQWLEEHGLIAIDAGKKK